MSLYNQYKEKLRKLADINYSVAVLGWDQETNLPPKGAGLRAQQISTLAGIAHEMATSEEMGDLLGNLNEASGLDTKEKRNLELSWKQYNKSKKFSTDFIVRMSKATSNAYQAWVKARQEKNFSLFEKELTVVVNLLREKCDILEYEDHPYDVLLDVYEPDAKTAEINVLFEDVKKQLVDFVQEINDRPQVEDKWMYDFYDKDIQWDYGIDVLRQMGYDFKSGRQDLAAHPFTTSFGTSDVRVTTRINENNFHEMLWSCIHEGGHALYEQGLPEAEYGLPTGSTVSLGMHESQSRLWENNVGRCLPFWKYNYPKLQKLFPNNLKDVSLSGFYKSMNMVKPSFIRVNADELTYHFHIMIRFELEKGLIEGSIEVKDIPELWNQKYKEYMGIDCTG